MDSYQWHLIAFWEITDEFLYIFWIEILQLIVLISILFEKQAYAHIDSLHRIIFQKILFMML